MKTRMLLTTLFLAAAALMPRLEAQTYQPFPTDHASWQVVRCWYFYNPGWHDRYTITMDGSETTYEGETFKNLYITIHHLPGTPYDSLYPRQYFGGMREEDRRIYMFQKWASVDTTVQLVYDFSRTAIGDTIFTSALHGNPARIGHLVTATDSVLIGTRYHRRLYLQDPSYPSNFEYWIEGVGSSWGLPFATFWSATDNSYDLTCFYREGELVYGVAEPTYGYCQAPLPVITCDPVLSVARPPHPDAPTFLVFPNPAAESVTVFPTAPVHGELTLQMYDITGALRRSMRMTPHAATMHVGDLRPGVYVLRLTADGVIMSSRRIVIQR